MQIDLDDNESYFVEKVLDDYRDNFLRGLAYHAKLVAQDDVPKEFKDLTNARFKEYVKTFDMIHSVCGKFELARLGGKNR